MKKTVIVLSMIGVTACSSLNVSFKKEARMPTQQNHTVIGKSCGEIRQMWGTPLRIRHESPNQLWTYREDECTHLIYFDDSQQVCFAEKRGNCPQPKNVTVKEMK